MSRQRADGKSKPTDGPPPLRLGVIGLGAAWRRRYRPALLALADQFSIDVVCDQVLARAEREARQLGCAAANGPVELVEGGGVEALLLADAQWFGLWPVELACRAGKPVLCGPTLDAEDGRADALVEQVRKSGRPVMAVLGSRAAPATERLRQLLAGELGPARLLLGDVRHTGRSESRLLGRDGVALLDWLGLFLDGDPISAVTSEALAGDLLSLVLEFDHGRAVHLRRYRAPDARPRVQLRLVTERGVASVRLPDEVAWGTAGAWHRERLRGGRPVTHSLLMRFADAVRAGRPVSPALDETARVLNWLRLARRSLAEGRRVPSS